MKMSRTKKKKKKNGNFEFLELNVIINYHFDNILDN